MKSKAAARRPLPSGTGRLMLVMVASIVLSVAGVGYAVIAGRPADGGRGGAVAVALTFAMVFLGRGTAEEALEVKLPSLGPGDAPRDFELELARLRNAVSSMLDWQSKERLYLTVASVVGTLAWGFGDVLAVWLAASARAPH